MRSGMKLGYGSLLPAVLGAVAALGFPAALRAQGQAVPSSNSGFGGGSNSFSGGLGGLSGGANGLSGGLGGLSGGANGFSGGMSGFSGGANGFSGSNQNNQAFRGGFFGTYQGSLSGGGSSTTGTATNAFGRYYFNPLSVGWPNGSATPDFTGPSYGGGSRGSGSFGGGSYGNSIGGYNSPSFNNSLSTTNSNLNASGSPYGNTPGARRMPNYTSGLGATYRPVGPSVTPSAVEQILARSTGLNPNRDIRVVVEGPAVILRGTVASDHDRRLAETLIRLSPGVYQVRNELQVPTSATPPAEGP